MNGKLQSGNRIIIDNDGSVFNRCAGTIISRRESGWFSVRLDKYPKKEIMFTPLHVKLVERKRSE